jgi:type IV pilus assembly protein PilV
MINKSLTSQSGFSLMEVMISAVVLSIGLVGAASVQSTALRSSHNAYIQGVTTMLLSDLSDRMRTNMQAVENNAFSLSSAQIVNEPVFNCFPDVGDTDGCTADEMAQLDLFLWQRSVKSNLRPGSDIETGLSIEGTPVGRIVNKDGIFYIAVLWTEAIRSQAFDDPNIPNSDESEGLPDAKDLTTANVSGLSVDNLKKVLCKPLSIDPSIAYKCTVSELLL